MPVLTEPKPLIERLADFTFEPDGCWHWRGPIRPDGYGVVTIGGVYVRAHRAMVTFLRGPIPRGLTLDHLCRVRHCVNPSHLEAVTSAENVRRGLGGKTHCIHGHTYTPENTYTHEGHRHCKECRRISLRRFRARRAS